MKIPGFFYYGMNLPQVTAAFSTLTAFKRQGIQPPITGNQVLQVSMLMSPQFTRGMFYSCTTIFLQPRHGITESCPSLHALNRLIGPACENEAQVNRGLNGISQ
jgi:hypothetical protein